VVDFPAPAGPSIATTRRARAGLAGVGPGGDGEEGDDGGDGAGGVDGDIDVFNVPRSPAHQGRSVLRSLGVSARPARLASGLRGGSGTVPARRRWAAALCLVVTAVVAPSCGRRERRDSAPAAGTGPAALVVVARVGGVAITAADVAAQMAAFPAGDRRRALDDRILFELLAQEAARQDLPPDKPDEHAALVAAEAQRLVERDIEPQLTRASISDADVRAVYERNKPRFVHGRLVQAAVVHVFTGARMKAEPRAKAEQNARLLRAALDQHPPRSATELEAFVSQREWTERNVGLTKVWQDVDGDEPFPPVVARALRPLTSPGALTPLVGDETGYYVPTDLMDWSAAFTAHLES